MKIIILLFFAVPLIAMDNQKSCEEFYQMAIKSHDALGKEMQNRYADSGDVITLIAKCYKAVQANNATEAEKLFSRFHERAGIDYKYLSSKQRVVFSKLYFDLGMKVWDVQPESIKKMNTLGIQPLSSLERLRPATLQWLKKIIEADQCIGGVTWRENLVRSDKAIPLPHILQEERLKTIADRERYLCTIANEKLPINKS